MKKLSKTAFGVCVSAIAMTTSLSAAYAQDEAAPAEDQAQADQADSNDGGPIVVTGSRIKQPDYDSPSPIFTVGADTLQSSGTTNLTDFLTGYPALIGSSTSGDNSGSGAGIGATGLNLLNLRNLGTERTLVLVDGRRHVSGLPGSASIDINTIPNDLVERIEVLTGGASAIYGADGVSGVVNFILKKDFEGISVRGQAGISEHGDAGQRLGAITIGHNFADGRGNIAVAYEYGQDDRLETRDRGYLSGTNAIGFFQNPADGVGAADDPSIPDRVPLANIRYFDTTRDGGIDVDFDGFPDFNGDGTPYDPGTFVRDFYQQGGSGTLVSDYGNDLLPSVSRHVVNAIAHFDVSDKLTVYAEGKYANVKSFSLGQPTFDYYLFVPEDNPYIPASLAATIAGIGNGGVLVNRDNFDLGQRGENIERETWRGVIGVKGDISPSFSYDLSAVYGRVDVTNHYVNDILDDRFYAAIDVVNGPNGPTCRVNLDPNWTPDQPFTYIRDVIPPTTFSPGQCVPLNIFGENKASQAALDFITVDTTDHSRIEQFVVSGAITGDFRNLFSLPGGELGFALGGEYRKEKSSFVPDPIAAQGLTFTNALAATTGQFSVKEAFAELRAPILADMPFAHELTLGAAIRYSDYTTIGSTTTWKVDGSYAPIKDITFRGTYSQAVRAPNIGELFDGGGQTFLFVDDPCNVANQDNGESTRPANCAALLTALGADPNTYTDPRSVNIPGIQSGNPNLIEEKAKTWTAGAVIRPSFIPGLNIAADWYNIKLKNAVNTVSLQQLAELCVDQADINNQFCAAIQRDNGTGYISGFTLQPQNVASFETAGLDVNINYALEPDWNFGKFNFRVIGNYLDKLTFIGTPGAPVTDSRGTTFAPKFQVNLDATWKINNFSLNYGLSWYDHTRRFSANAIAGDPDIVDPRYYYYKERWQHDLYASLDVGDDFQIYGGVNNFTNNKPALGSSSYPTSAVGRFLFVGARAKLGKIF